MIPRQFFLSFLFACSFAFSAAGQSQFKDFFASSNSFLKNFVTNGLVNYQQVKANNSELTSLTDFINETPLPQEDQIRLAYLINVYNLLVISQVVENYPTRSPMDIGGFFDHSTFEVARKRYTLNDIENKLIRNHFKDARAHFVLVCGAKGCPPIIPEAYLPENVEMLLDRQTRLAINNPVFTKRADAKVELSEIFKWYKEDFGNSEKGIRDFINQYSDKSISPEESISYYSYDWSLNDLNANIPASTDDAQAYNASVLLKKGQFELVDFNNLYTQTKSFDAEGAKQEIGSRQSWFTSTVTFITGISKNARWNLGVDVNLRRVAYINTPSNALHTFGGDKVTDSRNAISSLGPKVRWQPLKNISNFTVQSSLWFPVSKNMEGNPWLDYDRVTSWTQLFYNINWDHFQLFTEIDAFARIGTGDNKLIMDIPATVIVSWFPHSNHTFYVLTSVSPSYQFDSYFSQLGLGYKLQLTKRLQLEALTTDFIAGSGRGAGQTFNIGVRWLKVGR